MKCLMILGCLLIIYNNKTTLKIKCSFVIKSIQFLFLMKVCLNIKPVVFNENRTGFYVKER
jgi:hypothetical protein